MAGGRAKRKLYSITVLERRHEVYTRKPDLESRWDCGSVAVDWVPLGLKHGGATLDIPFKLEKNTTYDLVAVRYETGSSFGSTTGEV